MPEDKPVTNILLEGGAEEFGREHIPKTPGSAFTGMQPLYFPCMQETFARTKNRPNLVSLLMAVLLSMCLLLAPTHQVEVTIVSFPFFTLGFNMCYFWTDPRCY